MARKESDVRVSIVVPHLGNDGAFEDSLVSVLENRPDHCEVVVVHDGHYADPFDLGGEVRFVAGGSDRLPVLVRAAASEARGRFTHVIGAGVRATENWVDAALEKFEHDNAAMVAPLAVDLTREMIHSAGWTSGLGRVMQPLAAGKSQLGRRDASAVRGACLAASFWRTAQLRQACDALVTDDVTTAQYGWSKVLRDAGWRCLLADQSLVVADLEMLSLTPSWARGRTLRSIKTQLDSASLLSATASVAMSAIGNLAKPGCWSEVAGAAFSLLLRSRTISEMQQDAIQSPEEAIQTIRMPQPTPAAVPVLRRAA